MRILFVLYNDFACNSANHVAGLADALVEQGHECWVAVPFGEEKIHQRTQRRYGGVTFKEVLAGRVPYADGGEPDVVHYWTPREIVRRLREQCRRRFRCVVEVVHLEDNEEQLLVASFGLRIRELRALGTEELDRRVPRHLSHPLRYREFLGSANGVTVLMESLKEFVPKPVPTCTVWPAADEEFLAGLSVKGSMRDELKIPEDACVLVYTGNVHQANEAEVRSLYLAVAMLNREGHRTVLVRTGTDAVKFLGEDNSWISRHVISLGHVNRSDLPRLMAMADVLVQPGRPDVFNDYRFPSKLPEFFAAGRPVVLPATNIGLYVAHGRDAYVLPRCDATQIFDAVVALRSNPELSDRLARGARSFYEGHFSWRRSAERLAGFYERLRNRGRTEKRSGGAREPKETGGRLLFHHIPKCGGTSVRDVFARWFRLVHDYRPEDPQELELFKQRRPAAAALPTDVMICGHFEIDGVYLHQRYPELVRDRQTRIITFVREPLDLRISLYYFARRVGKVSSEVRLSDYLFREKNYLARRFPADAGNYLAILDRYFFIGLTERIQLSVDALASLLDKPSVRVPLLNQTLRDSEEVTASVMERFREANALDYLIYGDCVRRFEAALPRVCREPV